MNKQHGFSLRILCILLTLCLVAIAGAPIASALTPEQEEVLESGQRSLNNPKGTFTIPQPAPTGWRIHADSLPATQMVLGNLMQHLFTANSKPEFSQIMAYAPLVMTKDTLPEERQIGDVDLTEALGMADTTGVVQLLALDIVNGVGSVAEMGGAVVLDGLNSAYFALLETGEKGVYDIIAIYTLRDGKTYWTSTQVLYDTNTGYIRDDIGRGIWKSGLEFDLDYYIAQLSPHNTNKRYGFNIFYDIFSPIALMYLDTLRYPFDYDGKECMVQIWKGSYFLISNGGEVSIYERPKGQFLQWDPSDDTHLEMTMQIYQGDKLFLDFGPIHSWWLGGFRFGNRLFLPVLPAKRLRMTGSIIFEDAGMRDAFWAAFQAKNDKLISGKMDGMEFTYDWQAG